MRSASLAEATGEMIEADIAPHRAWRRTLQAQGSRAGRLSWTGKRDGALVTVTGEPGTSAMQRLLAGLLRWLPGVDHIL